MIDEGKNSFSNALGFISCMIQSQTKDTQIVRDQKEVIAGQWLNILSLKITVDFWNKDVIIAFVILLCNKAKF